MIFQFLSTVNCMIYSNYMRYVLSHFDKLPTIEIDVQQYIPTIAFILYPPPTPKQNSLSFFGQAESLLAEFSVFHFEN